MFKDTGVDVKILGENSMFFHFNHYIFDYTRKSNKYIIYVHVCNLTVFFFNLFFFPRLIFLSFNYFIAIFLYFQNSKGVCNPQPPHRVAYKTIFFEYIF